MGKWIAVEDRLPKVGRRVLVKADALESCFCKDRKVIGHDVKFISSVHEYPPGNFTWESMNYHRPIYWQYLPK